MGHRSIRGFTFRPCDGDIFDGHRSFGRGQLHLELKQHRLCSEVSSTANRIASPSDPNRLARSRYESRRSPAGFARYLTTCFPNRIGYVLK